MLKQFTEYEMDELSRCGDVLLREDLEDYNRDVSICMKLPESVLRKALEKRLRLEREVLAHKGISEREQIEELVEAGLRFIRIARQYYRESPPFRKYIHAIFPVRLPWGDD